MVIYQRMFAIVLSKWRDAFSELWNPATESDQRTPLLPDVNISDTILDSHISILEVKHAIEHAKKERHLVSILYQLTFWKMIHRFCFSMCFLTSDLRLYNPIYMGESIICPIPKSRTNDPRDRLSYRGVSLLLPCIHFIVQLLIQDFLFGRNLKKKLLTSRMVSERNVAQ